MTKMKKIAPQQGWTLWSMLFVMSVIFVLAYIGMQLVPMYSANESVKKAMMQSVEDKDLRKITRREVVANMNRQLYLDSNHELLDYKNELIVKRTGQQFLVEANYEREIPLAYNLVLIARFNPKVECDLVGQCQ